MGKTLSFEVQSFRDGKWMIDSVYDDKEMAVNTGRNLLESRHHASVRVVSETYDDESGESSSRVVFKEEKRALAKMKLAQTAKKAGPAKKAEPKKEKEPDSFLKYVLMLVLSLGGIVLIVIILLFVYLEAMGRG